MAFVSFALDLLRFVVFSFRCVFVLSGFASFYVVLFCFVIFLILRFIFFSPLPRLPPAV